MSGAINGMDIWADGTKFVTGGDDKVKNSFNVCYVIQFISHEQANR